MNLVNKFWMRDGSLQAGPYKYKMGSLAYEFEVPFEDGDKLITAKITIYNLSQKTRKVLEERPGLPLILNAGYEKDIGTIFVGQITKAQSTKQPLDWVTSILATEAMDAWLGSMVNKTYKAGIDAMTILQDLLSIFGLEVSQLELAVNKVYPRGKVCNGFLRTVLKEIITSDCKSTFLIRNGRIFIKDPTKKTSYNVLLTPASGLLAANESKTSTNIQTAQETTTTTEQKQEKTPTSFSRSCLLNYRLGPGDIVRIQDKELNGDFKILKGSHKGSKDKDYKTTIEVKPA